jgi:hypothetical protein
MKIGRDESDAPGLSAAGARKIIKRAKPPKGAVARVYTVRNPEAPGGVTVGPFSAIQALCPKIKANTLKRRLDNHERDIEKLRESPLQGRHRGRPRTIR